jgi:hypothetical protein
LLPTLLGGAYQPPQVVIQFGQCRVWFGEEVISWRGPDAATSRDLGSGGIFGSHSLRSGFLTSGAMSGSSIFKLLEVSRHKSIETLRAYVRRADLFEDHAGAAFL